MRILQFQCPSAELAAVLIDIMTQQANIWSRLRWLTTDENYVTQLFTTAAWRQHTQDPTLYWLNWDELFPHLGVDGQLIAEQLLSPGVLTGILLNKSLVAASPDSQLQVLDNVDLVLDGYVTAEPGAE